MAEEKKEKDIRPADGGEAKKGNGAGQGETQKTGGSPSKPPANLQRRPPVAMLVWMLVFLAIAMLMVFKFRPTKHYVAWDQSRFELELGAGNVISAEITPENERILSIRGEFKPLAEPLDATGEGAYYRTTALFSERLDQKIREHEGLKVVVENRDTLLRGLIFTLLPVIIIVGLLYFLFSRQIKMAGRGAMQFGKSRARMFFPDENKTSFDDIAGADEAKEEIVEIIEYLKDPLKFKLLGGKIPKGALLVGPPGTGKTLLAKAVAGEANVPFFSISGSDFVEMFVGVGASRVRDMFEQARKHSPCLIFIDEIDAVGRSRFSGIGGGHDEREQTLNAMLVEMDGLETQEGVIILAATNRPDVLDPALQRPGRFDRQIVLDLPDIKGRRQILNVHVKSIKIDELSVNLDTIARGTPGFSGADLANLVNEAALLAARHNRDKVLMEDMEEARDKVRWGRERRSRTISDKERKLTAYHEAGHALVALHCPNAMPIHKVTIIPRGQAYLGATMHLPKEDSYTHSRSEFSDELAVLMGGQVAEKLIFNDITSGAAADIEYSTNLARRMICSFGMSDKLGAVQYGSRPEHPHLGRGTSKSESYSEQTAREIDLEIKRILDEAKLAAENILKEHRGQMEKLAQELLDKETLDCRHIKELLDIPFDEDELKDIAEAAAAVELAQQAAAAAKEAAKTPKEDVGDTVETKAKKGRPKLDITA